MKKALIASLLFFGSCKSTESVNRFAKSAGSGTSEISRSTLSFSNICRLYDPAALARFTDTSLYGNSTRPVIQCREYKTADSLVNLINLTLVNYFSMLQAISDKKLLSYNANDLMNSLNNIRQQAYPSFELSEEKVTAVKSLLNTILNEPLKYYRYKKLIGTMQHTDSSLSIVLAVYSFILDSALAGEINQAKANYTSFVYAPLYQWARTPVEKIFINQQYNQFLSAMDDELLKIQKSIQMIRLIKKDHYILAYGKPPAGFAYTEHAISEDIVLINKLILELIQLIK